jgi:aspartyl-tRNA synthetase
MQETVFNHLGMDDAMIDEQFGFFVKAFDYGTPPHGGIAFGLDRLVMILGHTDNIRDVIAFPKTSSGQCLMSEAPGTISSLQKKELSLK